MSTILSTVESYEDKVLELVKGAKAPVVEYVGKGVELVGDRSLSLPRGPPQPHRRREVADRLRQEAHRRQHRDRHRRPRDAGAGGRLQGHEGHQARCEGCVSTYTGPQIRVPPRDFAR